MRRALVVVAVLLAWRPGASADPDDLVARPLGLPRGGVIARLAVELNLRARRVATPLSVAPDVWVGLGSRWTVGLIHSNQSLGEIDAGSSLCLRRDAGCDGAYRGGGIDVRWAWREGALAVAPRGRLLVRELEPWKPAAGVGALARWTRGRYAITADPYLRLGLANRDLGNRAKLLVPVWLAVQPTCRWLLGLHTGWDAELATWRDGWHVPFALVVIARPTRHLDVGVEAGFRHLLGPQNDYKERAMSISLEYRR